MIAGKNNSLISLLIFHSYSIDRPLNFLVWEHRAKNHECLLPLPLHGLAVLLVPDLVFHLLLPPGIKDPFRIVLASGSIASHSLIGSL